MAERRGHENQHGSRAPVMRILIATDAWHPQVNGVVRTLTSLARSAAALGVEIEFLHARRLSVAARCRPIRACGWRCRTGARSPGGSRRRRRTPSISRPKARSAGRCGPIACAASSPSPPPIRRAFRNTSRCASLIPAALGYAVLRHFHAAAAMTMVATASLRQELPRARLQQARHAGRAASTPICSGPTRRPSSICRGRSS